MVSPNELTEEQLNKLMNNPEVVKTLDYEEMGVFDMRDFLVIVNEAENKDVFVEAVAERCGRVTESTVNKVIRGMINEADEYDSSEKDDDEETND